MRRIDKGPPPPALVDHRRSAGATYSGLRKGPVQERLCQVQHHLCCFCQSKIEPDGRYMRIAHFLPQSDPGGGADGSLDWGNMWGACCGGEFEKWVPPPAGAPPEDRERYHCDKLQADRTIHPRLDPARYVDGTIKHHHDGRVSAKDQEVNLSINKELGLNHVKLRNNRTAALERVRAMICEKYPTASQIERLIAKLEDPREARWTPHLDFVLWYLRKKASRARGVAASTRS